MSNDEWLEWNGGKSPVAATTKVSVMTRAGEYIGARRSVFFHWDHCGDGSDIVAYHKATEQTE